MRIAGRRGHSGRRTSGPSPTSTYGSRGPSQNRRSCGGREPRPSSILPLESDTVRQCEEMIHKVGVEIKKVSQLLQQSNRLVKFGELYDRKNRLEMEREQMECKLEEFRAAMECLLARLRKERGEEEMEKVEIFNLGHELDYGRIHGLMMRECRRLLRMDCQFMLVEGNF